MSYLNYSTMKNLISSICVQISKKRNLLRRKRNKLCLLPFKGQRTNSKRRGQSSEKPSRWSAFTYISWWCLLLITSSVNMIFIQSLTITFCFLLYLLCMLHKSENENIILLILKNSVINYSAQNLICFSSKKWIWQYSCIFLFPTFRSLIF